MNFLANPIFDPAYSPEQETDKDHILQLKTSQKHRNLDWEENNPPLFTILQLPSPGLLKWVEE